MDQTWIRFLPPGPSAGFVRKGLAVLVEVVVETGLHRGYNGLVRVFTKAQEKRMHC